VGFEGHSLTYFHDDFWLANKVQWTSREILDVIGEPQHGSFTMLLIGDCISHDQLRVACLNV